MTVYNVFMKDGSVRQYGQPRKDEYPVISCEVPIEAFVNIFPGALAIASDILQIIEGLYDDELTRICEDVVSNKKRGA